MEMKGGEKKAMKKKGSQCGKKEWGSGRRKGGMVGIGVKERKEVD